MTHTTGDRLECLGQIELNPALTRSQREDLEWCAGVRSEGEGAVVWELCSSGCCLRVAEAASREAAAAALQEVVDAAARSHHRCTGLLVVRRADGETFTLRVSRGRVHSKLIAAATPAEPRLATVTPLRSRRGEQRARL